MSSKVMRTTSPARSPKRASKSKKPTQALLKDEKLQKDLKAAYDAAKTAQPRCEGHQPLLVVKCLPAAELGSNYGHQVADSAQRGVRRDPRVVAVKLIARQPHGGEFRGTDS